MKHVRLGTVLLASLSAGVALWAQERGGGAEWLTAHGDAQATSWIRSDSAISVDDVRRPGFDLQWKVQLDNQPRLLNSLTAGVTANGVTLFVPMSLVAGSSNNVYAIDNETGYTVWQRHFDLPLPAATAACPGGMTAAATRIVDVVPARLPVPTATSATRGRGRGYFGVVGDPGAGVPIEPPRRGGAGRAGAARGGAAPAARGGAGNGGRPGAPGGPRGAGPAAGDVPLVVAGIPGAPAGLPENGYGKPAGVVYTITSDGMLHVLGLPSGQDIQAPARFLPPNAHWTDPIAVNTTLYAGTTNACGGAPNGLWAVDLALANKPVKSWPTHGGGILGPVAFTPDGATLLVAVGPGAAEAGGFANAIVALNPSTLEPTGWFQADGMNLVSGPLVFSHGGRDVAAAATSDGRIVLLDAHAPGGSNHATTLGTSRVLAGTPARFAPGALALWQEAVPAAPAEAAGAGAAGRGGAVTAGRTWLLVPVHGPLASGGGAWPLTHGAITRGAVVALQIADDGGGLSLEPAWVSRDLTAPVTPLVVHGVVFALSTGQPEPAGAPSADLARQGRPAVLYGLNGTNGAELWDSGDAMQSFLSGTSFWSATGQVYVGTFDGTVYAFGTAMERH